MDEFPPNTKKDQEAKEDRPEKVVEKVVTGQVVKRRTPLSIRFRNVFVGGDVKTAIRYVGREVLLPAFKAMVFDAWSEGGRRVLYREPDRRSQRPTGYPGYTPRIQYNTPVHRDPRERDPRYSYSGPSTQRDRFDIGQLILSSREDAEVVVDTLREIIERYNQATVGQLYELLGLTSNYTDEKWGWTNLTNLQIRQIREGYLIELPNPDVL